MRKNTYRDLLLSYNDYNAWKTEDSFPIKYNEDFQVRDYCVEEYIFEGVGSNRSQVLFEILVEKFKTEIVKIFEEDLNEGRHLYLFTIEYKANQRSRLRSYKGFVDKKLFENTPHLEEEIIINEKMSRFVSVFEYRSLYFENLSQYFFDSSTSFIISSKQNYFNSKFIEKIINLQKKDENSELNYLALMLEFCSAGDFIYRIGGDNGEEYWSIQRFKKCSG